MIAPLKAEQVARINAAARSWLGTPFMPNAAVKGAGVSCQKLVGTIYIEAGLLPPGMVIPDGDMAWGNAQTVSMVARAVERSGRFAVVEKWSPGDLTGFRFGGCVHHLGIVLNAEGEFIHVLRGHGVQLASLLDAAFFSRLEKIWRPIT